MDAQTLMPPIVTVITPTTGKQSLGKLIDSIDNQTQADAVFHLLLWDQVRHSPRSPDDYNGSNRLSLVLPEGLGRNGNAPGIAFAGNWIDGCEYSLGNIR
jgi:hypothetical protein